ncbi:cuticle protein CP14.6-like [Melitaea cinxia]|uniref:cuticle protein CP14.6-like n=1 Tax=Melitaea cinxia TaxID=113334 RepID=UPI001E27113A|nr:cuticle protein CP14.6-like [Melitaea cinxia]
MPRLLTLTHTMKSFVALFVVVAAVAVNAVSVEKDATILKQDAEVQQEKYAYAFETSNGIKGQESGYVKNVGLENAAIEVQGSNAYTGPDGKYYALTYIANENGYQPQGEHLPVTPEPQQIPYYILEAIEYIKTHAPKVPVSKE